MEKSRTYHDISCRLRGEAVKTYALDERNEGHVENEKQSGTDILPQDLPSIVLRADIVAAFSPVIEGQPHLS